MSHMPADSLNDSSSENKRRRFYLLLVLLFMLVGVSSCIVGYILGQRSAPVNTGKLIDTIILSPAEDNKTKADTVPLSLSGRVYYTNGQPYANSNLELHSTPRTTRTDATGAFFFYDVESGSHVLKVVDEDGNAVAQVSVALDRNPENTGAAIQAAGDGSYQLNVAADALLVEMEVQVDADGQVMSVNPQTLTSIMADGRVVTADGELRAEDGLIITPQGTHVFPDGTISVAGDGVLFNDGTYVDKEGNVTLPGQGGNIAAGGSVTLGSGALLSSDGAVTLPDGTQINLSDGSARLPDGAQIRSDGTVITSDGVEIPPDGMSAIQPGKLKDSQEPGGSGSGDDQMDEPGNSGTSNPPSGNQTPGTRPQPGPDVDPPDTKSNTPPDTKPEIPPDTEPDTKPEVPPDTEPDTKPDVPPDTEPEVPPDTEPDTKPNVPPDTEPDTEPEIPPDTEPDTEPEVPPETEPDTKPDVPPDTEPEVPPDTDPTPDESDTNLPDMVEVTENGINWEQLNFVDLFANSDSELDGKLYPGTTGYYKFNINNPQSYDIDMSLTMSEAEHEAGAIPFMYRLKAGNKYVAGSSDTWLDASELTNTGVVLPSGTNMEYTLEWEWPFESGNDALDTAIGSADNLSHIITINLYLEQIK